MTAAHLCTLLDRPYAWIDSKRRLARAHLAAGRPVDAAHTLPLSTYGPRDTFGAVDTLRLAIACEGEKLGLAFEHAAALAIATDLDPVLTNAPGGRTVWAWCIRDGAAVRYGCGSMGAYLSAYGVGGANAVLLDLAALWSRIRRRAAELGLALEPGTVRPGRRLRLIHATRAPRPTL